MRFKAGWHLWGDARPRPFPPHCGPSESPPNVTASEPLGGGMDIHKPKPWRGWPEFLKEIGTIVIGVLIALGAEQAVEALHWRHETHLAREALVFDFRRVIGFAAREDAASPCLAVRLDQLSAALD